MTSTRLPQQSSAFAALRGYLTERAPAERCELCSQPLAEAHAHLFDPQVRKVTCACDACSLLFAGDGAKYRRVPRRVRFVPGFRMDDAQWDALSIPINLAFFFRSTPADRVIAMYPSPAGPTESLLQLESWDAIVRDNPILQGMEPDVEALLVQRIARSHAAESIEYYVAPIDECFKLVGLIRARWRGLSGGTEVWEDITRFFADLRARATIVTEAHGA